jgi:hypothetical protein
MKVKREVSKSRIWTALIITALIFCLGVALGLIIDNQRILWSQYQSETQKSDYESLQWQYLFLTSTNNKEQTCVLLHAAFEKSVSDLGASLDKIQSYRQLSQINDANYAIIERSYLIDNLKYWLLATKTKEECGADYVVVLYFFSNQNCPICPDQGVILTYYKKIYGEKLLVFPIDVDLENKESSIKIIKQLYNITTLPSIVVENNTYPGVISTQNLGGIICDAFHNSSLCSS